MASDSPTMALARELFHGPSPHRLRSTLSATPMRLKAYQAAAEEIRTKYAAGRSYDPANDCRFRWLIQWCEVLEGTRDHIDPSLESTLRFLLSGSFSHKDLAAGERPEDEEPQTLAQGS